MKKKSYNNSLFNLIKNWSKTKLKQNLKKFNINKINK